MSDKWMAADAPVPLDHNQLQLWRIDISGAAEMDKAWLRHLTAEELARAEHLRAGEVRMQFVAGRSCLRRLLGFHLQLDPKDVRINLTPYGKPEIGAQPHRNFSFNVAHSRSTILIALRREGRVGVDLEYLDRKTDVLEIARGSFAEPEHREIATILDIETRSRAFFQCWTRKEAVVKADGRGLSLPLDAFMVPVAQPAFDTPVRVPGDGNEAGITYFVTDIPLGDGLAGASAVEAPTIRRALFRVSVHFAAF